MNYNKVLLIGNLTRDVELRYLGSGMAVTDLGLAVNHSYRRSDGEQVEETCFVDVTVWGRTAENCNQYLGKGSPIFVEGRLKLESWETPEGQRRSKHKVVADRVQFMPRGAGAGMRDGEGQQAAVSDYGRNYSADSSRSAPGESSGSGEGSGGGDYGGGAYHDDTVPF